MPGVTKEQIEQARQIDLLSYLQSREPHELVPAGNEYRTVSHSSLVISNGLWHWINGNIGGRSALDYLIKVRGMGIVDAVQTLLDGHAAPIIVPSQPVRPIAKKAFTLPAFNSCAFHAVAYLQRRGIDADIIRRCVREGRFYEGKRYHNCVFVGYDPDNKPRFACVRGTTSGFRQDVEGSDKRYGFVLPSSDPSSRSVVVFESPIDALSLATLRKSETNAWDRCHYLSLGGTSPLALMQYLKDHPNIDHVTLCLDNDKAGLEGMQKIKAEIFQDEALSSRGYVITVEPPTVGKDYNETLLATLQMQRDSQTDRRLKASVSI